MKRTILLLFLIICVLEVSAQNITPKIKIKNLVSTVKVLTSDEMGGRMAGSGYDLKTARYLERELLKLGYKPLIGDSGLFPFDCGDGKESYNVVMVMGQHKKNILIGAHYDHLGIAENDISYMDIKKGDIFRGANDNASGVATLMEVARIVSQKRSKLKHNVIVTAFGMEESRGVGSKSLVKYFGENGIDIDFMINLEMTGSLSSDNIVEVLGVDTFDLKHYLSRVKNVDNLQLKTLDALEHSSDHRFFVGISAIAVFATTDIKFYHHPKDTIELINFEGMKKVATYVASFVLMLAIDDELPKKYLIYI